MAFRCYLFPNNGRPEVVRWYSVMPDVVRPLCFLVLANEEPLRVEADRLFTREYFEHMVTFATRID